MILSAASKPSPANLSMRAIQFGFSGTTGLAGIESSNRGYKVKVMLIYSQVAMARSGREFTKNVVHLSRTVVEAHSRGTVDAN